MAGHARRVVLAQLMPYLAQRRALAAPHSGQHPIAEQVLPQVQLVVAGIPLPARSEPGGHQSSAAGSAGAGHDRHAPAKITLSIRVNDYHLAMIRHLAEQGDTTQNRLLRRLLLPEIEARALRDRPAAED